MIHIVIMTIITDVISFIAQALKLKVFKNYGQPIIKNFQSSRALAKRILD